MPPKWPTCARRFLSQCPLLPPPPGCALDHCPVAEHPGLRVSGEWEKGGWEGKRGRGLGKGETQWSSVEGRRALPSRVPLRFTGKPTSQARKATFLHLGQAQTVASNWDSRQRHGPSGILSFSFSFSFPPSLVLLSLSPSPFPPP